jgi:hypothetical protein
MGAPAAGIRHRRVLMKRKRWLYLSLAVPMAAAMVLLGFSRLGATALPSNTQASLASLKDSFRGLAHGSNPYFLEREVTRKAATIHSILTYAGSSARAQRALTGHLIGDLDAFSSRFAPGTPLEQEFVGKDTFIMGEEPWYGLTVDTYLLLELSSGVRSPGHTKEALQAVSSAQQALTSFMESLEGTLAPPDAPAPPERRESCPPAHYGSTPGAELAWCCEHFMMEGYASGAFVDLPEAQTVISDYKQWRDQALAKRGMNKSLPIDCAGVTMEYVKKLAEALG